MSTSVVGNAVLRPGSASIRSTKGVPVYECTYEYLVQCSAKDEPYNSVLLTAGIPRAGTTVEPTGYAVCRRVHGTRLESNAFYWRVVAEFSSEVEDQGDSGGDGGGDPGSDPEVWVPIYETKFERYQEVVTVDAAGTAVKNSAGEMFPTGITVTRKIPVWEFFQIESASVTDYTILNRIDVVNNASFTRGGQTYATKTLLCNVLSSVIGRYYGQLRRLTQYQVKYKAGTWKLKRADVGYRFKVDGSSDLIAEPWSSLVNLDGSGEPSGGYKSGSTTEPTLTPGAPSMLEFDIYPAVSFSFIR